MDRERIIALIKAGLAVIGSEQDEDGSFITLSSGTADFSNASSRRTTFAASNILHGLIAVKMLCAKEVGIPEAITPIANGIAHFLMGEKSEAWSWNYWSRTAKEYETTPYPDDLDDTFAALAALYDCDKSSFDMAALASAMKLLMKVEVQPGGPYRTWLVPADAPSEWRDVDVVANAGIGAFLARFDVHLANLERYIEEAILAGKIASPYYPSICHAAYFISRHYGGGAKAKLLEMLFDARCANGAWATPIESAMALSALVGLGFGDSIAESDIASLVEMTEHEGFAPHPFCCDPSRGGEKQYAGSRALTAAFIIEALAKWLAEHTKESTITLMENKKYNDEKILEKIKRIAREALRGLPGELGTAALERINDIGDPEIVLVPYRMQAALGEDADEVPNYLLQRLALWNLYGWIAYDIYDDFLDNEGSPRLLPVANFFLRQLDTVWKEFDDVLFVFGPNIHIVGFDRWRERLLNSIDAANLWEVSRCRLPVVDGKISLPEKFPEGMMRRFADRSIAHALPAIGVALFVNDENPSLPHSLLSWFRYYLAARQLHDDAHDWSDDLAQGRLTSINARLLEWWRSEHPGAAFDVHADMLALRRRFWSDEIEGVVHDIRSQVGKARQLLERMIDIADPKPLGQLLEKLEQSATDTLRERDETLRFLEAY